MVHMNLFADSENGLVLLAEDKTISEQLRPAIELKVPSKPQPDGVAQSFKRSPLLNLSSAC